MASVKLSHAGLFRHFSLWLFAYFLVIKSSQTAPQDEGGDVTSLGKEPVPEEENALSLWLLTRVGWVYCDRAAKYMQVTKQEFNINRCQKCYKDMFEKYKADPEDLITEDIVKCSRNFGRASLPPMPLSRDLFQRTPLDNVAVQASTCNAEIVVSSFDIFGLRQLVVATVPTLRQAASLRQFSPKNDPKKKFPRKSYINCLVGKIFETELSMCPMNTRRVRCARQRKEAAEEVILANNLPISYGTSRRRRKSRSK